MDVQIEGGTLKVKRELEGGWFQWVSMPLPAVLTIQSGINQLRYATLKGIMVWGHGLLEHRPIRKEQRREPQLQRATHDG